MYVGGGASGADSERCTARTMAGRYSPAVTRGLNIDGAIYSVSGGGEEGVLCSMNFRQTKFYEIREKHWTDEEQ